MRIAWFTPFSVKSAIGRYSQSILRQLLQHADVDLWLTSKEEALRTEAPIIEYKEAGNVSEEVLATYDAVVYNIGDYLPFHIEIYRLSQRVPGIVVLHDFVLHHLFAGLMFIEQKNPDGYIALMK